MNVEDFNNLSYDIQTKRYNSNYDADGLARKKAKTWLNSDISDVLLKEAKEIGYIDAYSQENAENLSFADREFDFALCKEAYHHFPRPMIALYEMLRVTKKGVVLIEPTDEYWASSFIEVLVMNIKNFIKIILGKKVVRHNYEEVGNYIYSISPREIEKVAVAMNFKAVAFKGINDYYQPGVEYEKATNNSKLFKKIKRKISLQNWQCRLKLKHILSNTVQQLQLSLKKN